MKLRLIEHIEGEGPALVFLCCRIPVERADTNLESNKFLAGKLHFLVSLLHCVVIVPFIVQIGVYASPVGFSSSIVPAKWRFLYSLNPMVGVIDGFRWALLRGESHLYWPGILASVGITSILCFSGTWYFRKMERTFADVI